MTRCSRATLTAISVFALSVCASCTDGEQGARSNDSMDTLARRQQPSARSIERAFARVTNDVTRCFEGGISAIRVQGSFRGEDGVFVLERATLVNGSSVLFAVETCVRTMSEQARVRPFRAEAAEAQHDFVRQEALTNSPANNSVVASDAGTSTAQATVSGGATNSNAQTTTPTTTGTARPLLNGSPVAVSSSPTHVVSVQFGPNPEDLVRREHDALQRCFEQAAEQSATLSGEIELHFTLDPHGHVRSTSFRIRRESGGHGLLNLVAECAESHIRLIAFGAQTDGGGAHMVPVSFGTREHFGPAGVIPVE